MGIQLYIVMDTREIQSFMGKIKPQLESNVYAANRLPITVSEPSYIISNLDPDTKPGSHWIAIYLGYDGIGEYFDSYGRKPTTYHLNFIKRNSRRWFFNSNRIQNDFTSVCGEYCLLYLYFKSKGKTMNDFVNCFSKNTLCNDLVLRNMFLYVFSK